MRLEPGRVVFELHQELAVLSSTASSERLGYCAATRGLKGNQNRKFAAMTVIALVMETGSFDDKFGERVATKLGLQLTDMRHFEREIAERCDLRDYEVHRLVDGDTFAARFWDLTSQQLSVRIREQTLQTAAQDNTLILGWSAASILQQIQHVVRVRILAPLRSRERNVMRQLAYNDIQTAHLEVESSDALIARFVTQTTGADWADPSLYDLVLNADSVSGETCIELIRLLAASRQFRETKTSREMLASELARISACNYLATADEYQVSLQAANMVASVDQNSVTPDKYRRINL
jgi:cytidylate kinase